MKKDFFAKPSASWLLIDFSSRASGCSPRVFVLSRVILGVWLINYAISMQPFLKRTLIDPGLWTGVYAEQIAFMYPGLGADWQLNIFSVLFVSLALLFTLGIKRKLAVTLFLPLWFFLHIRNFHVPFPADGLLTAALLSTLLIPATENHALWGRTTFHWHFPNAVRELMWFILLFGMFNSGLQKLQGELWKTGQTLTYTIEHIQAREGLLIHWLRHQSTELQQILTFGVLFFEIFASGLTLLIPKLRALYWFALLLFLLTFYSAIQVDGIVIGVLIYSLFLFDYTWLKLFPMTKGTRS